MIKLFRNIRKNLLNEGKTSKYFKYAVGEIVLVVIGILIALSINNWNEEITNNKKQIDYLKSIKNEMQSNLNSLNNEENRILDVIKNKEVLLKVMGSNEAIDSISDKTIVNLYQASFNIPVVTNIETGAVNEIISSGGLQFIKNDSIRKLIASWDTKSNLIKWQENNLDVTLKKINDLLYEEPLVDAQYFYSQFSSYDAQKLGTPNKDNSLKKMIRSAEFKNLSYFHYGKTRWMIYSVYPQYRTNLKNMIDLINQELEK